MQVCIDLPVYKSKVFIGIEELPKGSKRALEPFTGEYRGMCHWYNDAAYVHIKELSPGVLAHEVLHAGNFILGDVGCVASFVDDEQVAYHLGYIINRVERARSRMKV
jgi:hypothetical protein